MPFEPVPVTTEDFKAYLSDKHGNCLLYTSDAADE